MEKPFVVLDSIAGVRIGPLAEHLNAYLSVVRGQGYAPGSARIIDAQRLVPLIFAIEQFRAASTSGFVLQQHHFTGCKTYILFVYLYICIFGINI